MRQPSPFAPVARGVFSLRRSPGGPAYAVAGGFVFTLDAKGVLSPIRPLVAEHTTDIGAVGASPDGVTYVETLSWADSAGVSTRTVSVAGSSISRIADGERFIGFFPWRDGAVLAMRSNVPTPKVELLRGWQKSRFAVLGGGRPKRLPTIPANLVHQGQFAAYTDGRVLLVAAERSPEGDPWSVGPAFVLDYPSDDGPTKRIELPVSLGVEAVVSAGRTPAELLVFNRGLKETDLWRLEGGMFERHSLHLPLPLSSLSRADDGGLWVTTGYWVQGSGHVWGGLYRVTITGPKVEVVQIHLPPCAPPDTCMELQAFEVLARSENDVWVTASVGSPGGADVLLHTQPSTAPAGVYVLDEEKLESEAWAEVPPPPYTSACQAPLLVLGRAEDLKGVGNYFYTLGDLVSHLLDVAGRPRSSTAASSSSAPSKPRPKTERLRVKNCRSSGTGRPITSLGSITM